MKDRDAARSTKEKYEDHATMTTRGDSA